LTTVPGFDDKLTRELERAVRPAAPDPVRTFEDVTRRRAHRTLIRKVQVVIVVVAILVGTAGAFVVLDDRFEGNQPVSTDTVAPPASPSASMLQWRQVVSVGVTGMNLTCEPRACSETDLAPDDTIALVGIDGKVYELGPVIVDGTSVLAADAARLPDVPELSWSLILELDEAGAAALNDAIDPAGGSASPGDEVATVWMGTVISADAHQQHGMFATEEEALAVIEALGVPSTIQLTPEGEDIGLASRMCDVQKLGGLELLGDGTKSTAWTAYPVNAEGHCPRNPEYLVAVDVTGDGVPDASTGVSLVNCPYVGCFPLGATDLDADGDGELIVSTGFSEMDQGYFSIDVNGHDARISPILVAAPGHPAAGIEPGAPLVTSAGGDEGYASWIMCEGYPEAPVLVYTRVLGIVESDKPEDWHEVKLQLQADGMFHVVDARDASLPPDQDPGWPRSTDPACGIDFNRFAPPNPG
jgi:hypothetical protein